MTIPGMTPATGMVTFALLGLCIGSFLNVCISRWPAGLSIVSPRSRCPNCERPISALENIPLVSWIVLRAKCRGCGLPISIGYPAVELLVGLIWLWCAYRFGATFTGLRVAAFASFLVGVAITDAKHYVIPDGFTIAGLVWVLATAVAMIFIDSAHAFDSPFAGLYDGLIGNCPDDCRIRLGRWSRNPSRPENIPSVRSVRDIRHHGHHGAEHARGQRVECGRYCHASCPTGSGHH